MRPILIRLGLRYISRRLFQSMLFVLGVALGVAVVIAIDIANASASRAFTLSSESIVGRASHQLVGGPNGFSSALYTRLRLELGIKRSAPVVSELARISGSEQALRLLGVDPLVEAPFRPYLAGEEETDFAALNRIIAEPGSVIISDSLAERLNLSLNDQIELSAAGRFSNAQIAGILKASDNSSRQALDDLIITDIATAQEFIGGAGRLSRIDLILEDADVARVRAILPTGVALVSVKEDNALDQMIAAFEINLQSMSMLALVVGLFLIYNTVTFSVVQRRQVIGIMRSLGTTKGQVFAFILGEALMLGTVGTVLGMALGIIFGRGAVSLVSQTISDLYFAVNVRGISIDGLTLFKAACIGLLASLAAAFFPSLDATRTPPAGVMKRSNQEERTRRLLPTLSLTALLLTLLGFLLLQLPDASLYLSFAALFCIIVGGALFTPAALLLLMRLLLPVCGALFGVLGRMACRAVVRSLSRTSVAVAALTIAVSVIVGVSAMIGSFRNTVSDWLDNSLGAQIFVSPPLFSSNYASVDVDRLVVNIALALDGVQAVSSARHVAVSAPAYPDLPPVNLLASDFDIAGDQRRFKWSTVSAADHQQALDAGLVMVSEPFAYRRGIDADNNRISLLTDSGEHSFEVFGVYYDYSTDQGTVYMARAVYDQYFADPFISSLGIFTAPDADIAAVIDGLREALVDYDLLIQDNAGLRRGALEVFDRTFAITIALRALTTLVAFIGILSALMALQLEHTREYGTMRATGMTGGQLTRFTLIQTGLMGVVAGILALPIGTVLSLVLIFVVNERSFGWTMQFSLLPGEYLEAFLVALLAAILAGVYPALRLARLQPAEALRSE